MAKVAVEFRRSNEAVAEGANRRTEPMSVKSAASFASTLFYESDPVFAARARLLTRDHYRRRRRNTVVEQVRCLLRVLGAATTHGLLLLEGCEGNLHPDLLASAVIGLWPSSWRPAIVMAGDMWQPDSGLRGRLQKFVVRLADRAITRYAVQSSEELESFPRQWGVGPSKMRLCLYFCTLPTSLPAAKPTDDDDVFVGGDSHRDYEPVIEAARCLPRLRFFIAARRLGHRRDLPANVTARPTSRDEFIARMIGAPTTIVPLRRDLRRTAGQQTYLNAMRLGKPVIVSDAFAVKDHITSGVTGLVVDGSAGSYVRALEWVFDPANDERVRDMGDAARNAVLQRFCFEHHASRLLEILDDAYDERTALAAATRSR